MRSCDEATPSSKEPAHIVDLYALVATLLTRGTHNHGHARKVVAVTGALSQKVLDISAIKSGGTAYACEPMEDAGGGNESRDGERTYPPSLKNAQFKLWVISFDYPGLDLMST
jgi:hypothetical protein